MTSAFFCRANVSRLAFLCLASTSGASASAQIDSGSTGVDGVFPPPGTPVGPLTVDLSLAPTLGPGVVGTGNGVYDPDRWMVIFNYSSVDIPPEVQVVFKNHPSRAPVVWLVDGNVNIVGDISLNGGAGSLTPVKYSEPGPGGFRGGIAPPDGPSDASSSGFGPGGGFLNPADLQHFGTAGSYATLGSIGPNGGGATGAIYGDPSIFQLVGGSGGSAGRSVQAGTATAGGGGSGGGAILIAADGSITIGTTGSITAIGGSAFNSSLDGGGGSGGAIRLVADLVFLNRAAGGTGAILNAGGGSSFSGGTGGGSGRIRIESNNGAAGLAVGTSPPAVLGVPGQILPPVATIPSLRVSMIAGFVTPTDPRAGLGVGSAGVADIVLAQSGLANVEVVGDNIPIASRIFLRLTKGQGIGSSDIELTPAIAPPIGNDLHWTRTVSVNLPTGFTALQARAQP